MFRRHLSGQLVRYNDRQLAPLNTRQAELHLAQCSQCRGELDRIGFAAEAIRYLPTVEAPESIWTSVEAALDAPKTNRRAAVLNWRLAAGLLLAIITTSAAAYWYTTRITKGSWEVVRLEGSPTVGSKRISATVHIAVGDWLRTDGSSRARIKVGDIGLVEVGPNTRVRVLTARPAEHRLALARGQISAHISAPPRLFFVETPSSTAIDLGCAYTLQVDDAGFGLLRVTLGWVSLGWGNRESLVPAGANCHTRPGVGPGTPYFEDTSGQLQQALAKFDFETGGPRALDVILAESRVRDSLTLWHLLSRVEASERGLVFDRIAALTPVPGISRQKALALDPETLTRWKEELAWTW